MPRKVFDYDPPSGREPPEFELAGETFRCQPSTVLSSLDVLDFLARMTSPNNAARIQATMGLFNSAIREEDIDRFRRTVRDGNVPLPTLNNVAAWLLDEYLAYPTRPGEPSSNGSPPGSPQNEDGSSPRPAATSPT